MISTTHNKIVCCILLLVINGINATDTIKGDESALPGQTFSFRVHHRVQNYMTGGDIFVGAHPAEGGQGKIKQFALSRLSTFNNYFESIAPEKVSLDLVKDQPNPLFDQGIAFLSLLEGELAVGGSRERPVVVTQADLSTIYLLNTIYQDQVEIVSAKNIPDAHGQPTSGIVGLTTGHSHVFAAVKPAGTETSFGDYGSGISPLILGLLDQRPTFTVLDAATGSPLLASKKAAPLDKSSWVVKIGNDLSSLSVADMYFDRSLNRVYIALQAQAGAQETDGVRALVIGYMNERRNNRFVLLPIAPDSAFSNNTDAIIGAQGAHVQVSLHKVRPLITSTSLNYIVVQGGKGAPADTKRKVFAVPLVAGTNFLEQNGTIANKLVQPDDIFSFDPPWLEARFIRSPAVATEEMISAHDAAARVGAGAIEVGDICDIFVHGDTVFVSVPTADVGYIPGIFYSQALFDDTGKIKAWTRWQRAMTTFDAQTGRCDRTAAMNLNYATGVMTEFIASDNDEVKTVKRTQWSPGDAQGFLPVSKAIEESFSRESKRVHGLFDVPYTTKGLKDISLQIVTGKDRIMLVQTGYMYEQALQPLNASEFCPVEYFYNGSITKDLLSDTRMVTIIGGALQDIGPILAATVATDGISNTTGWIVVGGSRGVAVLSQDDGSGWDPMFGLSTQLHGLCAGMSFKKIGDYRFVRKLVADEHFLYILTDSKLDRIDLSRGINPNNVAATTIATASEARGTLLDFVVSEKCALLATSTGLYRIGNGADVRSATQENVGWTRITLNEGLLPIMQLVPVSVNGLATDFARFSGGHILVLSSSRGRNIARVHRLVIDSVENKEITDTTIQPFPDFFVKDLHSYFISFGMQRNKLISDGSLYFSSRKESDKNPFISLLQPTAQARTGVRFLGTRAVTVPMNPSDACITSLTRNSASGNWMIAGDFGLRINE